MAATPQISQLPAGIPEAVVYRMHVSQKYLDLTKQKLELTRLPRVTQTAGSSGISKAELEHLVDHWTEGYSWRAQENFYNHALPQYRMPINGTRIHFVHRRSRSPNSMPLLFLHGFPDSFIAVSNMIDALCDPVRTPPRGEEDSPAFHVVAPSIPGFGFSDQVPEDGNNLAGTADIFNALMHFLGYDRYLLHGSGWGFYVGRQLALTRSESCIGLHTANLNISPPSYNSPSPPAPYLDHQVSKPEQPQTISYALCDSPTGLLAYIVDAIGPAWRLSSGHPAPWTPTMLINWTMIHWLPGPEVALRWLENSRPYQQSLWTSFSNVPLAISLYERPGGEQSAPGWAEQLHPIAMVRNRTGIVQFPAWERPAEIVHDLRDLARLLSPSYLTPYDMYTAGTGYDQTPN